MSATVDRVKTARHALTEWEWTSLTANTAATLDYEGVDENCVLLVTATADDTLTVSKGNHIQGVADLALSITANKLYAIALPSMEFKNVSGTNKGFVVVTAGKSTTSVALVEIDQL